MSGNTKIEWGGTPGPWHVGPVDDTLVSADDGSEVAAIDGDYNSPDLWPIMEANARAIAEVPALIAALIQYRDDMRHPPAADSRERRIAMIDGILNRIDGGAA